MSDGLSDGPAEEVAACENCGQPILEGDLYHPDTEGICICDNCHRDISWDEICRN